MKKKTEKLLALLLALIMVLALIPTTAMAITEIETIEITDVIVPEVGEVTTFDFKVPDDAGYDKDYENDCGFWAETDTEPADYDELLDGRVYETDELFAFKENKYYTFVAFISLPKDGYEFANDYTATINGEKAKIQAYDNLGPSIWYCFGLLTRGPVTDYIDTIEITDVITPEIGKSSSFDFTVPGNAGYGKDVEFGDGFWSETAFEPESFSDLFIEPSIQYYEDFTFKEGKYYTFVAYISLPKNCYAFADGYTATINGENAGIEEYEEYGPSVWYCFGLLGDKPAAFISGISAPDSITIRYKDEVEIRPEVFMENGYVEYFTSFESDDNDIASVNSELGIIYAVGKGTTIITTKVVGEDGYIYTNDTAVTVKYTWWQWIIKILLFGFIWY